MDFLNEALAENSKNFAMQKEKDCRWSQENIFRAGCRKALELISTAARQNPAHAERGGFKRMSLAKVNAGVPELWLGALSLSPPSLIWMLAKVEIS